MPFSVCVPFKLRLYLSLAKGWYLEAESYLATTSRLLAGLRLDKIVLRHRSVPGECYLLLAACCLPLVGTMCSDLDRALSLESS